MSEAMSMRDLLGPHIPYLRRHARALAGSQKSGDSFVRAALETLVEAPDSLEGSNHPRRDLFRLFHAYWGPHHGVMADRAGTLGLTGSSRDALLLTAVEGFSLADTALILGSEPGAVEQAIAVARDAISAAIRSRVMIIEDEPIISMHLEEIVTDMGHDVVATAMTRDEAVAEAGRAEPDLVLADIQLADGTSGLDAVEEILKHVDVPVIFITAYPERLLTGERTEPTFLVTKPFEPDTVVVTIGQALLARYPELAPEA